MSRRRRVPSWWLTGDHATSRTLTPPSGPEALCRTEGYPDDWHEPAAELSAVAVCLRCPLLAECRAYALAADEQYGVWGGLTESERESMRRAGNRLEALHVDELAAVEHDEGGEWL